MITSSLETRPLCNYDADSERPAGPPQEWARAESRPRILYVDDDATIRKVGMTLLTRSGYHVDTAADGLEALAALRASPYNLLITDHEMPRLTGLQLAAQARLAGMNLPIVLASGSVEALEDTDSEWLGFAARLAKPFNVEALLETVSQALSAPTEDYARAAAR